MRAELPWNVAGIPPEAREAARASARREGLSVGEWLTRRILRSFSDPGEEREPMSAAHTTVLDAWGLPPSAAARRDTEEMLARVSRSETESDGIYRRIEEQLRGVARRLDSSERSQSESNRVLSRTAAEMNIAAREQTQAFDQMSQAVTAIDRRLDALEQARGHEGLKEAVKALHLGLSRLADQITATATQSGNQVGIVASNLEQVAGRLADVRSDSQDTARALEQRLSTVEKSTGEAIGRGLEMLEQRLGSVEQHADEMLASGLEDLAQRLDAVEQAAGEVLSVGLDKLEQRLALVETETAATPDLEQLEGRVAAVEKSAHIAAETLEHTRDTLDSSARDRAGDRAEFEHHAGQVQDALTRLEEWMERLEQHAAAESGTEKAAPDPQTAERLNSIERALSGLTARLEHENPVGELEDGLHVLAGRIQALENERDALPAELRAAPAMPPPAFEPAPAVAQPQADPYASAPLPSFETHPFLTPDEEAPPFAEPPPVLDAQEEGFADLGLTPGADLADAFPQGFEEESVGFAAEHEPAAAPEDFLTAARRSARAASEKAEAEKHLRGFSWSSETGETGGGARPRLFLLGGFALVVVLVLAAALVLSRHAQTLPTGSPHAVSAVKPPAPAKARASTPALAQPAAARFSAPSAKKTRQPSMAAPDSRPAPNKAPRASTPLKAAGRPVTADRLVQLANTGDPVAETILGLHYLEGAGGLHADAAKAAKWLGEAAGKGQPVAQYRYGTLLERGQGIAADQAKAMHWYRAAAALGNLKAMHNLAVGYAQGADGKKDMGEAARWFAKAAGLGLPDSQFNLAVLYERGEGVPKSMLDACKWYAIAAAEGDAESRQRLSVLETQLPAADRAAAQRAADGFHPAPLDRSANVPPEMRALGE